MGWAKYREDIVSRWVNDNRDHMRRSQPAKKPAPAGTADANAVPASKQERRMSKLTEFTMASPRPLPVILLADVSGSMSVNGKIEVLNDSVAQMIATFAAEDGVRAEIHVAVIAFGGNGATLHKPLRPAHESPWEPMKAAGRTPMGSAFALAREVIEDREVIPSRAYRPTLVWRPTDEYHKRQASNKGDCHATRTPTGTTHAHRRAAGSTQRNCPVGHPAPRPGPAGRHDS